MSFIVFVVLFPYLHPCVTFILSFWTPSPDCLWTWSLTFATFVPVLSRYNCFPLQTFFFFSRAFFEGPLLMQFPVILLALSLNLNWLRWSSLGLVPRTRLPKPVCDINGPCTSSSSLWILLACGSPLMLPLYFSVRSNCESKLSLAGCKSV